FTAQLSAPVNGQLSAAVATITIVDDDPQQPPASSIGFDPSSYTVGESGGTITLTVKRTGATAATSSVAFTTGGGGASAGADFTAAAGTLTFAPGETSKTFAIAILDDANSEGNESFAVQLSSPSNGVLAVSVATVTIVDDDQPATYRFLPASYEVSEGAGSVTVTVVREGNIAGST